MSTITSEQLDFYHQNKSKLIADYFADFPLRVDPDNVRDLFMPIGYNRNNVKEYDEICSALTEEIFYEALKRNAPVGKIIFAGGLPGSGKSSHLDRMTRDELVYDGTLNDEAKFIRFIESALKQGYGVEVFVYSANPKIAFQRNLIRGDQMRRYVPISHYEKVAVTLNKRQGLLRKHFQKRVQFRNFEHTNFEGQPKRFSKIKIDRDELERIARNHRFADSKDFQAVIK
jgi:hypothetical protein